MNALIYHISLQWRIDLRDKNVLLPFYIIPLVFFFVMSAVFNSILDNYSAILIPAMISFSITMAACLGTPISLSEIYATDVKRMYHLGNIPDYIPVIVSAISSWIHFVTVSLLIISFGALVFDADLPTNWGMFLVALQAFILASIGVGVALGILFQKRSTITMAGQAIFLPSVIFSGAMFPTELLPDGVAFISYILPASIGLQAMNGHSSSVLYIVILLVLFCLLMMISIVKSLRLYKQ